MSLGITITPCKICDLQCVYCQLGETTELTVERKEYIKIEEVLRELKSWLQNNTEAVKSLDYITISGSGEPTLNSRIGELINQIKKNTSSKVAVITNSSLMADAGVRREMLGADLIVPSLDTVDLEAFYRIDRPHKEIRLENIINGLIALRKEYGGKIWLEVMLVRGLNDDLEQTRKLKEVLDQIKPDKIHLNSPVRTTAEENILPVTENKLAKIKEILGDKCEII